MNIRGRAASKNVALLQLDSVISNIERLKGFIIVIITQELKFY